MLSRITYTLRETMGWPSAATSPSPPLPSSPPRCRCCSSAPPSSSSARFDNLLSRWAGDVEMIVYVRSDASADQMQVIEEALEVLADVSTRTSSATSTRRRGYEEAQKLFAGDDAIRKTLRPENTPTQFKVVPTTDNTEVLKALGESKLRCGRRVLASPTHPKQIDVVSRVSRFVQHRHHRHVRGAAGGRGRPDLEHDPYGDVRADGVRSR